MFNFKEVAEWSVGDSKINRSEIYSLPSSFLKIEIKNNTPIVLSFENLSNGEMEQRQFSILKFVENLCSKFSIPDTVFAYCQHDRSDYDLPLLTHSRLKNKRTRSILFPCFTFYGYPERYPNIIKPYTETYSDLISNTVEWDLKEERCAFIGSITSNNFRDINTDIGDNLYILNQGADSTNFVTREYLSNFKYLLHLNGNGGAYASRLKYLLGNKSLVFYNYNSGAETNFWEEFWMKDDLFVDGKHFISCRDRNEYSEKFDFYSKNQSLSKDIADQGFDFYKNFLSPDKVDMIAFEILKKYTDNLI
jgi:hypothetical protein